MKKQSGFTLIELMVVMAIIAILATAGLSAYTGYIKKARDSTRIADLAAINTIVLGQMSTTGLPPVDPDAARIAIKAANNDQYILDPRQSTSGTEGDAGCLLNANAASTSASKCAYYYQTCSSATQYRILTRFESTSNQTLYNVKTLASNEVCTGGADCVYY